MKKNGTSTCPKCGFDYKKINQQQEIIVCPKCGQSCADISNTNFIRVIDGLIPREPKDNK